VTAIRKVQLALSQSKRKGDEVKDEDDDVVRTSVSQDRVTATLCTYINCQHDTLGGPAGSHTSQLDLFPGSRASDKAGYFVQLSCDWRRR
jgi:hypothetical protein